MATSAQTLNSIIKQLLETKPANYAEALKVLDGKGLLPKKLVAAEEPKLKKVSVFASKQAEDYKEANDVVIPEGFVGTGNNSKITVKDLKGLAEGPKKPKVNASPSALQWCRDNGVDISRIATGSGAEGKILLKDVKDLVDPDPPADTDDDEPTAVKLLKTKTDKPKLTPAAAKLMKQYDIDEEDIKGVAGTGKDGAIKAEDLDDIIQMIKDEEDEE